MCDTLNLLTFKLYATKTILVTCYKELKIIRVKIIASTWAQPD